MRVSCSERAPDRGHRQDHLKSCTAPDTLSVMQQGRAKLPIRTARKGEYAKEGTVMDKAMIEQMVAEVSAGIPALIRERLSADVEYAVKQAVLKEVSTIVSEYVKEQIVPDIRERLKTEHSIILAGAVQAATEIAPLISAALVKKATENLSNYRFGGVLEALFK